MKRLVLILGIALSVLSCAQHDTNSPDTAGTNPQNPNRTTGDTMTTGTDSGGNNVNNDNTNNNQQVNTGDSSMNNRRN